MKAETDPKRRKAMLAGKVEDMLNTVVRQIAFVEFERRFHDERRAGELTAERIGEIWMDVQKESLGPAIRFEDEYRWYWTYIPHFIHTPFYVYAYAFGDCLVNSLYAVYQGAEKGFAEKYLDMLKAGGTQAPQGIAGALRPRRLRSEFLAQGPVGHRGLDRPARGDGLSMTGGSNPYWRWTGRGVSPKVTAMADGNNLPRRVQRYARVSTAMGGLAARLAGTRYLGMKLDRGAPRRRPQVGAGQSSRAR